MKKRKNRIITKIWDWILQVFFPRRCPVCDGIVWQGEKICAECLKKLKLITPPWCMKCGKKLKREGEFCEDCKKISHSFIRGRALYEYESVQASIYRFKYAGRREYAEFYGEEIAFWLGDFIHGIEPDALIPIPLHKKRLRKRGYNQAEVLAKKISERTGVPTEPRKLVRVRNTKPLKLLSLTERQNNLKKAFIMEQNEVKLERVIIIDDIYTTGSTVDAAASALAEAGVKEIYFITIACGTGV